MRDTTRQAIRSFVPVAVNRLAAQRAGRLMDEGVIAHPSLNDIGYDSGACWSRELPRTAGRYLHGFLFFADWHHSVLPNSPKAIEFASEIMLSWIEVNSSRPGSSQMAFHDETTAQRSLQMIHFLDHYGSEIPSEDFKVLRTTVHSTAQLLLDSDFYAGKNNHGMFQDIALLRFAAANPDVLFPLGDDFVLHCIHTSVARLYDYFKDCFTWDGVHVENSPSYHFMVSKYVRELLPVFEEYDHEKSTFLERIYVNAERYATHVVLPNGFLPPISDTKVVRVRDTGLKRTFEGPEFKYSITQGVAGIKPKERTLVLSEAGYAIHRTAWGSSDSTFVLFKAGYKSNYHHHADDLSLIFYTAGRLILAEAGPFGYDYSDPLTKYAFSQYAHNTVIVDGRSQSRVDSRPSGVFLENLEADNESVLNVLGVNARDPGAVHKRSLKIMEYTGHTELHVSDYVEHLDDRAHEYEVLWHLGSGVRPVMHQDYVELFLGDHKVVEMSWNCDDQVVARLVRPTEGASPRAYRFPAFGRVESGSVLTVCCSGAGLEMKTVIRCGGFAASDRVSLNYENEQRSSGVNATAPSNTRGVRVSREGTSIVASCLAGKVTDYIAFYLYQGSSIAQRVNYGRDNVSTVFEDLKPGTYRVRSFLKQNSGSDVKVYNSASIDID